MSRLPHSVLSFNMYRSEVDLNAQRFADELLLLLSIQFQSSPFRFVGFALDGW